MVIFLSNKTTHLDAHGTESEETMITQEDANGERSTSNRFGNPVTGLGRCDPRSLKAAMSN